MKAKTTRAITPGASVPSYRPNPSAAAVAKAESILRNLTDPGHSENPLWILEMQIGLLAELFDARLESAACDTFDNSVYHHICGIQSTQAAVKAQADAAWAELRSGDPDDYPMKVVRR